MNISIVVPVYNEDENLSMLFDRLMEVIANVPHEFQIIFINDGSTDRTSEVLKRISDSDNKVRVINFPRNYGQTAALNIGFQKASGNIIITMDADMQNDPADIPRLIEAIDKGGVDVVSGWRYRRKDPFARKIVSKAANALISKICGLKLHDYGCTLKAYRAEAVKNLQLYGEMHRYIPAFIYWNGGKVEELKVAHNPRIYGKSSYGMTRIYRVILDLLTTVFLTTYSTKPIHVFGMLGLCGILSGFSVLLYVIVRKIYLGGVYMSPLFFAAVFLMGVGLILIFMGILAEISVRIYFAQKDCSPYKIDEKKDS